MSGDQIDKQIADHTATIASLGQSELFDAGDSHEAVPEGIGAPTVASETEQSTLESVTTETSPSWASRRVAGIKNSDLYGIAALTAERTFGPLVDIGKSVVDKKNRGKVIAAALIPAAFIAGYVASDKTQLGNQVAKGIVPFITDDGNTSSMSTGGNTQQNTLENVVESPSDIYTDLTDSNLAMGQTGLTISGYGDDRVSLIFTSPREYFTQHPEAADSFVGYLFGHFDGTQLFTHTLTVNEEGRYDVDVASSRTLRGLAPNQSVYDYLNTNFGTDSNPVEGSLEVLVEHIVRNSVPKSASDEDIEYVTIAMSQAARIAEEILNVDLDTYATSAWEYRSSVPTATILELPVEGSEGDLVNRLYRTVVGTRNQMDRLNRMNREGYRNNNAYEVDRDE